MIGLLSSVCLSVYDNMHCGTQEQSSGLKFGPYCSYYGTSYSPFQTLLLWDVSFSYRVQRTAKKADRQREQTSVATANKLIFTLATAISDNGL